MGSVSIKDREIYVKLAAFGGHVLGGCYAEGGLSSIKGSDLERLAVMCGLGDIIVDSDLGASAFVIPSDVFGIAFSISDDKEREA